MAILEARVDLKSSMYSTDNPIRMIKSLNLKAHSALEGSLNLYMVASKVCKIGIKLVQKPNGQKIAYQ